MNRTPTRIVSGALILVGLGEAVAIASGKVADDHLKHTVPASCVSSIVSGSTSVSFTVSGGALALSWIPDTTAGGERKMMWERAKLYDHRDREL